MDLQKKDEYPQPSIGILVLHPFDDKILLLKSKITNYYRIPRGHIYKGESIEEAIIRIVKETIGMQVDIIELITLQESIFSKEFKDPHHFIFLNYLVKAKTKEPSFGRTEEYDPFEWVDVRNSKDLTLNASTRALLNIYTEKVRRLV